MPLFNARFRQTIYWLLAAGLFVNLGLLAGFFAYLKFAPGLHQSNVAVQNHTALLREAATHDLVLEVNNKKFTIKKSEIQKWLEPYTRTYTNSPDTRISSLLDEYVRGIAQPLSKDPVDAKFVIENGTVTIISPDIPGSGIDVAQASQEIREALLANVSSVSLSTQPIQAAITPSTIAGLHITEKLATGESNFSGSSASRIQNIKVSSAKYNGLIIKAGTTFSFNDILGPVDADGGYAPELVIADKKVEYQYGGGICQVSTTLFRAAIFAGLPIVERRPHSFPVGHYNPQGFDATIYPGVSDLKFTNNTPGDLLLQTRIVGKEIYFDLYGTSDGRVVTVDGPYQYDIQPDGSMKAYFVRTISFANGASTSHTFNSVYKSPQLYATAPNPYQ